MPTSCSAHCNKLPIYVCFRNTYVYFRNTRLPAPSVPVWRTRPPIFRNDLIGELTMDATSKAKTATLTVGNKTYDFPILSGTVGPDVVDIAKLYGQSGMFTYDPGFTSTASCQSKITYIDGDAGILEYRGYPIEQLAENGDFLETCYLLLYGNLPTPAQKKDFDYRVTHHTMLHEQMARSFPA